MTILIAALILAATLGLAFAVSGAKRAGYRGFWAFFVWALLLASRETYALAEGIREGQRHRAERKREWDRRNGFEVEA